MARKWTREPSAAPNPHCDIEIGAPMLFQTYDDCDEPPAVIEYAKAIHATGNGLPACEYCDAVAEIRLVSPYFILIQFTHDDDCPRTGAPPRVT